MYLYSWKFPERGCLFLVHIKALHVLRPWINLEVKDNEQIDMVVCLSWLLGHKGLGVAGFSDIRQLRDNIFQ